MIDADTDHDHYHINPISFHNLPQWPPRNPRLEGPAGSTREHQIKVIQVISACPSRVMVVHGGTWWSMVVHGVLVHRSMAIHWLLQCCDRKPRNKPLFSHYSHLFSMISRLLTHECSEDLGMNLWWQTKRTIEILCWIWKEAWIPSCVERMISYGTMMRYANTLDAMLWHTVIWSNIPWLYTTYNGIVHYKMIWRGTVYCDMIQNDMISYDVVCAIDMI